jgi:hypothetical protein
MCARSLIASLVDAKRKLDWAAQVLDILEHTSSGMVSDAERAECVRIVGATRLAYNTEVDALGAEERWTFVLQLMLEGVLPD